MKNTKLLFSSIKKEHLPLIKDWRNQQRDILRQVKLLTDGDQKKWFERIQKDKTQVLFSIVEDKKLIGYCGLTNIDYNNKRAEISFLENPERVDNKAMYEKDFLVVLQKLTDYGFSILKLHKIFTETYDFRKDHIEILENFGLKKEAVLKKHYFKKGRYCDTAVHVIFNKKYA